MCGQLLISCVVDLDRIYSYYPLNTPQIWYKTDENITIFHFVYKLIRLFTNSKRGQNAFLCAPRPLLNIYSNILNI